MGPGIITSNVDNDAGGITTYSVAGAALGYKILWVFLPMIARKRKSRRKIGDFTYHLILRRVWW